MLARSPTLFRFVVLYGFLYSAFGVSSPFLPAFLDSRGLGPEQIGLALAAGTAVRLISGPFAGRLADLLQALRAVFAVCAALAAIATLLYFPAWGFWTLLPISLLHAALLAPLTTLADALALGAAVRRDSAGRRAFEYGWVRGAGSAAFIIGSVFSGQAIVSFGLPAIVWLSSILLAAAALAAFGVPELVRERGDRTPDHVSAVASGEPDARTEGGMLELLRTPAFRRLTAIATLVLGSHAMHDAFAMIRWTAAGIGPGAASVLWSESVAAEVVVFFVIGPALLNRIGPAGGLAIAAFAGLLRWTVMGATAELGALGLVQPLHGLTFALLHLSCMRVIAAIVPPSLAGTAQAIYGTSVAAATALLTLFAGALYARFGAHGFFVMAALCIAALPFIWSLRGYWPRSANER